jgi:CheY-like chemotaxis protein
MHITVAENGKEALQRLENDPDFNLVLMDIMMPEMDGYEAMKEIRKKQHFKNLPIIALTAKAMKGDRQKSRVTFYYLVAKEMGKLGDL